MIAGNLAGNSSLSNCVNITISVPITPIMNSISPNPSNTISVDLSWTNLGVGVNYYLYVSFSPLTTVNGLPFYENLTTNSFIDTVYSTNTYYYAVMASSNLGNSSLSNCVNVTTMAPATPIMNSISPNPNYTGTINLSWTDLGAGITYLIYRDINPITSTTELTPIA